MVDWDGIIDREGPAVWRTVCRLLTHRADAEECFQETFLAALQLWRREPMRSPRACCSAWPPRGRSTGSASATAPPSTCRPSR